GPEPDGPAAQGECSARSPTGPPRSSCACSAYRLLWVIICLAHRNPDRPPPPRLRPFTSHYSLITNHWIPAGQRRRQLLEPRPVVPRGLAASGHDVLQLPERLVEPVVDHDV